MALRRVIIVAAMKTKRVHQKAVRATVSMPPMLHDRAVDRMKRRGFAALSDYIQDLIRRDEAPPLSMA
jgi:hypothetical protein